jgi:hypothetical protein
MNQPSTSDHKRSSHRRVGAPPLPTSRVVALLAASVRSPRPISRAMSGCAERYVQTRPASCFIETSIYQKATRMSQLVISIERKLSDHMDVHHDCQPATPRRGSVRVYVCTGISGPYDATENPTVSHKRPRVYCTSNLTVNLSSNGRFITDTLSNDLLVRFENGGLRIVLVIRQCIPMHLIEVNRGALF